MIYFPHELRTYREKVALYYVYKGVPLNIICKIPAIFLLQFPEGGNDTFLK